MRLGLFLLMVAGTICGCAPPAEITPLARLGVQDIGFAEPALARSVNAFLGTPEPAPSGRTEPATGGGTGSDTQDSLPAYRYKVQTLHETALGVSAQWELDQGSAIGTRLLVGKGRGQIVFPDGVDVFVDPLTVSLDTKFIEASFLVEQSLSCTCFLSDRVTLFAEGGHRRTWSDTTLRSALIARDDTGNDSQTFAGAGARIGFGPRRKSSLDLGLRKVGRDTVALRLGLEHGF